MRMWMVNPSHMCLQHILGEHTEIHMWIGTLRKRQIKEGNKFLHGLLDFTHIKTRHDALLAELAILGKPSGTEHKTSVDAAEVSGYVEKYKSLERPFDVPANHLDLITRCERCAARYALQSRTA